MASQLLSSLKTINGLPLIFWPRVSATLSKLVPEMKVGTTPAFFIVVFDGSELRVPTNVAFLILRRFSSAIVASLNFRPVVTNTGAFCELANANAEMAISGSASTLTKIALCEVVQNS